MATEVKSILEDAFPGMSTAQLPQGTVEVGGDQYTFISMVAIRASSGEAIRIDEKIKKYLTEFRERIINRVLRNAERKLLFPGQYLPYMELVINQFWSGNGLTRRLPVLGVKEIFIKQDLQGDSEAQIGIFVPDRILAEATFHALEEARIKSRDPKQERVIEIWMPMLAIRDNGNKVNWEFQRIYTAPISRIEVEQWPYLMRIYLGTQEQIAREKTPQKGPYRGKPIKIIRDLAEEGGFAVFEWPLNAGLGGFDKLHESPEIVYDPGGRPIADAIEDLISEYGLVAHWWTFSPKPILIIWDKQKDPVGWTIDKGHSKTLFDALRGLFNSLGLTEFGVFNVLFPWGLDPFEAEKMAILYDANEKGGFWNLLSKWAIGEFYPGRGLPASELGNQILNFLRDKFGVAEATFQMAPLIGDVRVVARTPMANEITSPGAATEAGYSTGTQGQGGGAMNQSAGRTSTSDLSLPAEADPSRPYVYEIHAEIPPIANIMPGLPTFIVGFPPWDGPWLMSGLSIELNDAVHRCEVVLKSTSQLPHG